MRIVLIFFALAILTNCSNSNDAAYSKSMDQTNADSLLRHVVLFKFKDGTTTNEIKKVEDAFNQLPTYIAEIKGFEWGINNSPEGLDQGFTHCFFLSFDSEEGRDTYLPHPKHKAFGELLTPYLDKVLVVDYWVK